MLDKSYEDSTLADLVNAPVAALAGVTDADAEHLAAAFGIKTVGDFGRNKYARAAAMIADLADHSG